MGLGAADVPVYFNESPDRLCLILNHSESRVAFAAGADQARKLMECRALLPRVEHFILAGAPADLPGEFLRYETLIASAGEREAAEYRRRAAAVKAEDIATLIYTSGTTGEPKGVMLSHANISSNDLDSSCDYVFQPDDVGLSFLPLSHVYERMIDYSYIFHGVPVAYTERPEDLRQALLEVRPTLIAAVPRAFEKIYEGILARGQQLRGWRRSMFEWALGVAREAGPWRAYGRPVSFGVKLQWALANVLAFPKIRRALGGRLRSCSQGGGPLRAELIEFFTTVGVPIYQGYGLTETSPVVSTNRREKNKVGTVGKPIKNVQVRIAADGEILVKGPCIMQGYFKNEAATRAALTEDGWLHTGDIGHLDGDGYLTITDRKKDLIKTAAGKFVAPQPIENKLKTSPLISNAAVVGDRRKFVVALIVPNAAAVEERLRAAGVEPPPRDALAEHPRVRALIAAEVERLTAHLAQFERVKCFALLDHDFSFDGGQLTYTMKLKRHFIEERYEDIIERLYQQAEAEHAEQAVKSGD
jgi:long-chain acyl-CoA synthetase